MKVLALYNIKGGVGKTAAAVNLAYLASREGYRTLLWDLDPQGAATFYFRIKPKVKGGGRALVERKRGLADVARGTDFDGLDVVPGDFSYRHLDLELDQTKKPTRRLSRLLRPLRHDYDLAVLDCAPSISLTSEAVFLAADALAVPTIPTDLSLRTLAQLRRFLRKEEERGKAVPQLLSFFSMVDRRKRLHRTIVEEHGGEFLAAVIPYSSLIERMGGERAPVAAFAPSSDGAASFADLWREIRPSLLDPV